MGYLSQYKYDVFVSYAHVDNQPVTGAEIGWVSNMISDVETYVGQSLGRMNSVDFWLDKRALRGRHPDVIPNEVYQSALFLAIVSPGFVESWFIDKNELDKFCETIGAQPERAILAELRPLEGGDPEWLGRLVRPFNYCFWENDKQRRIRILGAPKPNPDLPEDRPYYRQVQDLADTIVTALKKLNADQSDQAVAPAAPAMLLAQAPRDLVGRRDDLAQYLRQRFNEEEGINISIIPATPYSGTKSDYEKAFAKDLARSTFFVQLLGGKRDELAERQYEWAESNRTETPRLRWLSTDPQTVVDAAHKAFLRKAEKAGAMRMEFQKFKETIYHEARKRLLGERGDEARSKFPLIFIDCNPTDDDIKNADRVRAQLAEHLGSRIDCERPWYEQYQGKNKTRKISDDIAKKIRACDSLLILRPKNDSWVQTQIDLSQKLRPNRDFRVWAVSPTKPALPLNRAGLEFIDRHEIIAYFKEKYE